MRTNETTSEMRLSSLRTGWRGRLSIACSDSDAPSATQEIVGTIVEEASGASEQDDGSVDTLIVVCANYADGRFGPLDGAARVIVDLDDVRAAVAM